MVSACMQHWRACGTWHCMDVEMGSIRMFFFRGKGTTWTVTLAELSRFFWENVQM